MTPDYYLSQLKDLQPIRPELQPGAAAGPAADAEDRRRPGGDGPRWTEWTDAIMKAWQGRSWSWDMDGLSLQRSGWP
jgi:alpha-N-arabinofuranosidase